MGEPGGGGRAARSELFEAGLQPDQIKIWVETAVAHGRVHGADL